MAAALMFLTLPLRADEIYGSGDFIINDGPVYSTTGSFIGSSSVSSLSGSLTKGGTTPNPVPVGIIYGLGDPQPHSITVNATNGTVTKSPDLPIYDYDAPVTLTAVPDPGYIFINWTEGSVFATGTRLVLGSSGSVTQTPILSSGSVTQTPPGLVQETYTYWTSPTRVVTYSPTLTVQARSDLELTAHFAAISRVISVDGSGLIWPQQVVGQSTAHPLKIQNTGNSPLTVSEITYPPGYSCVWSGVIPPGATRFVDVTFAPMSPGAYAGNIEVHSDATAGTATVAVSSIAENVYALIADSEFRYATILPSIQYTTPESRQYWRNSVVNVQARPVSGFVFSNWTENGAIISDSPIFPLTMNGRHQLQAHYETVRVGIETSGRTNFGTQPVQSVSRRNIWLKNTGNIPTYVSDLRIVEGTTRERPAFGGHWSGWIAPGSSQLVSIRFRPSRKIRYTAKIQAVVTGWNDTVPILQISGSGR